MAKIKEQDLEQYLKSLDKKTLIGLYLQKTFDDDYVISDLKHQLHEKNDFLRRYQYHYSEPYAIDNKKLKEELALQRKLYEQLDLESGCWISDLREEVEDLHQKNVKQNKEIRELRSFIKRQRKETCREIAEECVKHVELIDFGNNHSEFMILASDLNECLNEVIKRR